MREGISDSEKSDMFVDEGGGGGGVDGVKKVQGRWQKSQKDG